MGISRVYYTARAWLIAGALFWFVPLPVQCSDNSVITEKLSPSSPAPNSVDVPPQTPASPWQGDLHTRSQLTGDWFGRRDDLASQGVTLFGDITQYYQGVASGGREQTFRYGGRGDYLIDFDFKKMGLWDGGRLDLRAETKIGQDTNRIDGSLAPSNFAMALPFPEQDQTALTGVQITQNLSERLSIFAGKLNLLDGTPQAYAQGRLLNYFWNAAMQSNLSRTYLIPSALGAGFTVRDEVEPVFSFYVLDTHYTPTTIGFPTLFSNGMLVYGEYRLRTNWFDQPGHSAFGLLYSTATRTSLDSNAYISLPIFPSITLPPTESSAWTVTYHFDQVLYGDSQNPRNQWGLNGDFGLTDGNPNPIRWFGNVSLTGSSPINGRQNDTIGIAYYHIGVSDLQILKTAGLRDENGVEFFYNIEVSPWCHVTPDLQILEPAQNQTGTSIVVGLRCRVSF